MFRKKSEEFLDIKINDLMVNEKRSSLITSKWPKMSSYTVNFGPHT